MRKVTKTKKKKGEGGKNLNPQRQQKCCQPQCCTFNPLVPAFCRQLAKPKAVQQFWALFAGHCERNNKKCRQLWLLVFLFFLFIFFCWPAKPLPSSSLNLRRRLKWQSFFLNFFLRSTGATWYSNASPLGSFWSSAPLAAFVLYLFLCPPRQPVNSVIFRDCAAAVI